MTGLLWLFSTSSHVLSLRLLDLINYGHEAFLQGAAEAHIVSYVAEGDAPDWGCDVAWSDEEATDEEATRQLENCVAVFGIMFRLSDEEHVKTDEFFFEVEGTANPYLDETDGVCPLSIDRATPRPRFTFA